MVLELEKRLRKRQWSASVSKQDGRRLEIEILSPPTAFIGKWDLRVETYVKKDDDSGERKEILKYEHKHPIYMIFNPLNKGIRVGRQVVRICVVALLVCICMDLCYINSCLSIE